MYFKILYGEKLRSIVRVDLFASIYVFILKVSITGFSLCVNLHML